MTRRLLLSYLSIAALVLLGLEIPLGFLYSRAERERITNSAQAEADSVSDYAALSILAGRPEELPDQIADCARRIGGKVLVVDREGALLAASHPLPSDEPQTLAERPEIAAALRGRTAADVRTSTIGGIRYLSVAVPVQHGSTLHGAVRIALPTEMVTARVHQVWLLLAVAGVALLTAVVMVAFGLARWIGRPILELEGAADRLAGGSLATPASVTSGPPEVRSLAATFNRTAALLEHLLAAQRAFAGEASHQLKTPLAALRLRLDNLEPDVPPHVRGSLTAAMTETDRLARMVEGLLALARMDEKALTPEPVDLDKVCEERAMAWRPLYQQHGVRLLLVGDLVGHAFTVPGAAEQILDNLLSNALRVAPLGSTVTVVRRHGVELQVIDEGPGMTAEQRRRAFDRFWRAPDAPKGGTGLGLSLVQRLTLASGGVASLDAAPGGGLKAVIRLKPVHRAGRPGRYGRPGARRSPTAALPG